MALKAVSGAPAHSCPVRCMHLPRTLPHKPSSLRRLGSLPHTQCSGSEPPSRPEGQKSEAGALDRPHPTGKFLLQRWAERPGPGGMCRVSRLGQQAGSGGLGAKGGPEQTLRAPPFPGPLYPPTHSSLTTGRSADLRGFQEDWGGGGTPVRGTSLPFLALWLPNPWNPCERKFCWRSHIKPHPLLGPGGPYPGELPP